MARNLHTYTTIVKRRPATVTVNVTVELLDCLAEVRLADDRVAPVDRLRAMARDLHGGKRSVAAPCSCPVLPACAGFLRLQPSRGFVANVATR